MRKTRLMVGGVEYEVCQREGYPAWTEITAKGVYLVSFRPEEFRMWLDWLASFERHMMAQPELKP